MRIVEHPILGTVQHRKTVHFNFNGETYSAIEGEPIAAALLVHKIRVLRYSEKEHKPRGIYCGIGHCYECRVTVDGTRSLRACMTPVTEGMNVESQGHRVHED